MAMDDAGAVAEAVDSISDDEVADLALQLANVPGPTGHEAPVAQFLAGWLSQEGIPYTLQQVFPERPNVVATLRGTGGGRRLLFNAHMDVAEGAPEDRDGPPQEPAVRRGDRLYGKAVMNDRGPLAATLMAARALKRAGVILPGDVLLSAVVGEIGMAPVDEFQGGRFEGKGVGSRYLVTHGVVADGVLVAETTDWGVTWVECGAAYFKITLRGEAVYTPRLVRPTRIEAHPNAIVRAARVVELLETWGRQYEASHTQETPVGSVVPRVNIGAVRGGLPHRPNRSAPACHLYLDVRVPPGEDALEIQWELEGFLSNAGFPAAVEMYLWRKGHVGKGTQPLVTAIQDAFRQRRGEPLPPVPTHVTSMWRDINVFNEVGIPAVTFGPPRRRDDEGMRYLAVSDLAEAARLYTLVAAGFCGAA